MIRRLSKDIQGHLRTGVALTGVAQAVEELVLNAVDAGATCVAVRIDLPNLTLQVIDNGTGIPADQLPLVGERYSTNKCHKVEDLENLKYFGYRGEALASLCATSSFLEIITRSKSSTVTYTKCFHKGNPLSVQKSHIPRPSSGTTVNIQDLFYNLPVRKKSINEGLEMEKIRYCLAGLALMWPSISVSLRDDITGNVILQTHKCSGVLATFSSLFGGLRAKSMCEVSTQDDVFKISGYVGRENYSRKDLQFVFVNKRLVLKSKVHKVVNTALGKSTLIKRRVFNTDRTAPQSNSGEQDKGLTADTSSPTKHLERYGVFVINIECPLSAYDITFDPAKTLLEFHDWPGITSLIENMIMKFLKEENLLASEQQSGDSSSAADGPAQSGSSGMPDTLPESVDPFEGNTEEFSEELLTQQQQKRYTQGISTHNSLNSLFSRTVRRPHATLPEDEDLSVNPSCAKKCRADGDKSCIGLSNANIIVMSSHNNRCTEMSKTQQACHARSVQQEESSDLNRRQEKPFLVSLRKDQRSNDNSKISGHVNSGVNETEKNPANNQQTSFAAVPVHSEISLPATSQRKTLAQRLGVQAAFSASSNTGEIRLPEGFAYTSSLSRLRSEMCFTLTSTKNDITVSIKAALQKFSRTRGRRVELERNTAESGEGKCNGAGPEENVAADNDGENNEIVLPTLRRPSLYRSRSLDAGQVHGSSHGNQSLQSQSSSHSRRRKCQVSDDMSVRYSSSHLLSCSSHGCHRVREPKGSSVSSTSRHDSIPNIETVELQSPEASSPARVSSYSGHADIATGWTVRGKLVRLQATFEEENHSASTSRKRVLPPSLTKDISTETSIQTQKSGQRLSQAAKLARLVRREQEPASEEAEDADSSEMSMNQNIHRVQHAQNAVHENETHATSSPVQWNTLQTDAIVSQDFVKVQEGSIFTGKSALQMLGCSLSENENRKEGHSSEDLNGESFQQPSFVQTPHTALADSNSAGMAQHAFSDLGTQTDSNISRLSYLVALFETPHTVFSHHQQLEIASDSSSGDSLSMNTYGQVSVLASSSGDASAEHRRCTSQEKEVLSSSSQLEGSIPSQSTQGFVISSTQGFVPRVNDQDSMPFDPSSTVSSSHTDSPLSAHSVGFSPAAYDPMLSDAEEGSAVSVSPASKINLKKCRAQTRDAVCSMESNLPMQAASGVRGSTEEDVSKQKLQHCDRTQPEDALSHDFQECSSTQSVAQMPVTRQESEHCQTDNTVHTISQDVHTESGNSDSVGDSETQAVTMTDSSSIPCGQRTPECASSSSHHSQSYCQDSLALLFHDRPVPTLAVPVLNSSCTLKKDGDDKQLVQANQSGAVGSQSAGGDGSVDSIASGAPKGPCINSKVSALKETSPPVSLTTNAVERKKVFERTYDLSALRGHTTKPVGTETTVQAPAITEKTMSSNSTLEPRGEISIKTGTETVIDTPNCDQDKTEVSALQQSADSFRDSLPDSALAGLVMPDAPHPTSASPKSFSAATQAGVPSSLSAQNAYNLGCVSSGTPNAHVPSGVLSSLSTDHPPNEHPLPKEQNDKFVVSGQKNASGISQKVAQFQREASVREQTMSDFQIKAAENQEQTGQQQQPGNGEQVVSVTRDRNPVEWVPVTHPKTGGRIYINNNSGHTLTQAQWETLDLQEEETKVDSEGPECHDAGSCKKSISDSVHELSPLSLKAMEALLADHFEDDDEESRMKWREGCKTLTAEDAEEDSLTQDLLSSWDNPVFRKPSQVWQVSEKPGSRAGKVAQCFLHPTTFTKEMLAGAKVIGQVDNKFVACLIQEEKTPVSLDNQTNDGGLIVLFDQHAAHERVRLEQLTASVYEKDASGSQEARVICRIEVFPPRTMMLSEEEVRLMLSFREEFDRIGIVFDVDARRQDTVHVHTMPACMAQREANDRKRGKDPLSYEYVERMIREHTQLLKTTAGARRQLPKSVHRLMATHACKGAVKFGDKLSMATCQELLQALSSCDLPFQCVHGRPSIAPLLSLTQLRLATQETKRPLSLWKLQKEMQRD